MERIAFLIAGIGGIATVSTATFSNYAIPKYFSLTVGVLSLWSAIAYRSYRGRVRFHWTPMTGPTFLFFFVAGLSTYVSSDWSMSIFGSYRNYAEGLLPWASFALLAYGIAYSQDHVTDRFIVRSLSVMVAVSSAVAVSQALGFQIPFLPVVKWTGTDGGVLASSLYGHPVFFGAVIAGLVPLYLHESIEAKGSDRLIGAMSLAVLLLCAVLTDKRGVWLGAGAGAALFAIMGGYVKIGIKMSLGLSLALSLGIISLASGLFDTGGDVARVGAWKIGIKTYLQNPSLGTGPDTFLLSYRKNKTHDTIAATNSSRHVHYNAHNDVIQVASTLGTFGIVTYLLLIWGLIAQWSEVKLGDKRFHASLFGGIFAVWVIAKVNPIPIPAMVLCAVLSGVVMRTRRMSNRRRDFKAQGLLVGSSVAAALVLFVFSARGFMGDAYYLQGVKASRVDPLITAQSFNTAAQWAPWEMTYRMSQAQSLFTLPVKATREMGEKIAAQAVKIGESCVRYHPNDPEAHRLLGLARIVEARLNESKEYQSGLKALDTSEELAPNFQPYQSQRAVISLYAKDPKGYLRSISKSKDLERLIKRD